MLERQDVFRAAALAWAKTGKRIAARIAMIAITTSSSINVNAFVRRTIRCLLSFSAVPIGHGRYRPLAGRISFDVRRQGLPLMNLPAENRGMGSIATTLLPVNAIDSG